MDFHSLTRKELQSLCKRNKIPANMTNVAMADALAALETIEGLDEFMNQSQSPEKTTATESIPQTANRTSTRRKLIKEDPETVQPMTRTRRATKKTLDKELDQENQNVNMGGTPAVPASRRRAPAASASKKMGTQMKDNAGQEMSCGVETETPMVQTGRRKTAQVGSTRRKLEAESVQRVYSTRRSVRLLERTLADLSLKDEAKEEPVKMDVLDETEEKNVSEVSLEKNNDSEVSSGGSFLKSLENEREPVEEVHEDKSNKNGEEDCNVGAQNSVNSDSVAVLDAKDDNHDETCDASDELSAENPNDNEVGAVDIPETESLSETENASINVMEPEETLAAEGSDEISAQVVEDVFPEDQIITSLKNSEADSDRFVANSFASPLNKQVAVECVEKESVHLDKVMATYSSDGPNVKRDEELESENVVATSSSDQHCTNSDATPLSMQIAIECVEKENVHLDNTMDVHLDNTMATYSSDGPNVETDNEFESDNATYSSDDPDVETDSEFDSDNVVATYSSDDSNAETDDEFDTEDEVVDVQLTEAEVPISYENKAPKACDTEKDTDGLVDVAVSEQATIKEEFDTEGTEEAEVPVSYDSKTPKYEKQISPSCDMVNIPDSTLPIDSISGDKTPGYCPMSPLGADSVSGQFPQPTLSTPKQASSKKHNTAQKLTLSAYNKENIDNSGMQLESKEDKVKKDKKTTDEKSSLKSLEKKSLRELSKMVKEKLIITGKNKNNAKTRSALQALPENVMAPADPNKEN